MPKEVTPISSVLPRERVRLSGIIHSVTYAPPCARAQFTAVLSDGSGSIELRWPGRRDITGLAVGQIIEVEGTVMPAADQHVIIQPLYRILSHYEGISPR